MSNIIHEISQGASPSMADIVHQLGEHLPLLNELEQTPQDPEWHAEGNVLVHTEMVLNETYKLLDSGQINLSPERRTALILGAALHDIAKPLTTKEREIDGRVRIVSPRHELSGRSYIALRLADAVPYAILDATMSIIGYHNLPKLFVVRNKPARDYHKLSRIVDMELVYLLEIADMRGRECTDRDQQLDHLEMFRMFAMEYGCWQNSREDSWTSVIREALSNYSNTTNDFVIANATIDREKGLISAPEEAVAKSYTYRDAYPEVVLMVGLSGSGKTSWIANNLSDHKIVAMDEIRSRLSRREDQQNNSKVLHLAKEELREHLRAKEQIVWDATSLRTDFRTAIINLAVDYGAIVTIVAVCCSQAELVKRNKTRANPIPAIAYAKQITNAQWPEITEAHRFLAIDGNGRLLAAHGCSGKLPYNLEKSRGV